MTYTPTILEKIRDIFSILHDGETSTWTGDLDLFTLKVNCRYLAELIDKSYDSFYVECSCVEKIELHTWMNPINLPQTLLTDFEDIFKAGLVMTYAAIDNNHVKITCHQYNIDFDYCGGDLLLNCKQIKIFDQSKKEITIDALDKISNYYWKEKSKIVEENIINQRNSKGES